MQVTGTNDMAGQTGGERRGFAASAVHGMTGEAAGAMGARSGLDLEDSRLVAYMLNPNNQLVWFNEAAREQVFGFTSLHPSAEMRNIFLLLAATQGPFQTDLVKLHAGLAKPLMTRANLLNALRIADENRVLEAIELFDKADAIEPGNLLSADYLRFDDQGNGAQWRALCAFFREGSLFIHAPCALAEELFVSGLGDRGQLMQSLAAKQSPMLTPMAVMVADLQDSVRLCAELPPQSYFELINELWNVTNGIVQEHGGQIGKHAGDGVIAYFFPRPGGNYLESCLACALAVKEAIARLSREWQLRRGWFNELYLNVGLHEGQEWVGTFKFGETVQLSALGDTINHSARLSEFARFGAIWASKSMVTRLESETGAQVDYGVLHEQPGGRQHLVRSSFAQVETLLDSQPGRSAKLRDIATMAVTEILGITSARK